MVTIFFKIYIDVSWIHLSIIQLIPYCLGYFDIKQSLNMKRRQDRSEALKLPDKTDPSALLALGRRECKSGKFDIAVLFISKACIKHIFFNWFCKRVCASERVI